MTGEFDLQKHRNLTSNGKVVVDSCMRDILLLAWRWRPRRVHFLLLWPLSSSGDIVIDSRKTCSIMTLNNSQQTNITNLITITHHIGASGPAVAISSYDVLKKKVTFMNQAHSDLRNAFEKMRVQPKCSYAPSPRRTSQSCRGKPEPWDRANLDAGGQPQSRDRRCKGPNTRELSSSPA